MLLLTLMCTVCSNKKIHRKKGHKGSLLQLHIMAKLYESKCIVGKKWERTQPSEYVSIFLWFLGLCRFHDMGVKDLFGFTGQGPLTNSATDIFLLWDIVFKVFPPLDATCCCYFLIAIYLISILQTVTTHVYVWATCSQLMSLLQI